MNPLFEEDPTETGYECNILVEEEQEEIDMIEVQWKEWEDELAGKNKIKKEKLF